MTEPKFFAGPAEFHEWLVENHEGEMELLVGFHKRGSGIPSMTWPESVDEALCVGWIDAVRRTIDAERYSIRFTRRKARSTWSKVNVARVEALTLEGRMLPAGLRAFAERSRERSGIYSYEQAEFPTLPADDEREFRENAAAWEFFASQPNWYRKAALWGVISAKRDDTKRKRLLELIDCSARGVTIPRLTRSGKASSDGS